MDRIQSQANLNGYVSLMTISYIGMRKCSLSSQPSLFSTLLTSTLSFLRTMHRYNGILVTIDAIITMDRCNEVELAKSLLDEVIAVYATLSGKEMVNVHSILLRTLVRLNNLNGEEVEKYCQKIESCQREELVEVEQAQVMQIHSAVIYCSPTEKVSLFNE